MATPPLKRKKSKENPKHLRFIREYFYGKKRGTAENCMILAGYTKVYAHRYAWAIVGISREVSPCKTLWDMVVAERAKIGEKWGTTEQEIMDGYIRDERFDPIDLVDPDTGLPQTDLRLIPKAARMSLKGLKVRQQILKSGDDDKKEIIKQTTEFQYPDKKGNRDSMAKILGLMLDRQPAAINIESLKIIALLNTVAGSQLIDELPSQTQDKL